LGNLEKRKGGRWVGGRDWEKGREKGAVIKKGQASLW